MKQHAIIAGVGPGMGLALSHRFAREGYTVSMLARTKGALADYERDIAGKGGRAKGYGADLHELDQVRSAFDAMVTDHGPADVLIYNAARWHEMPAMELDPVTFNRDLALCATGALACAQIVYPAMKSAGRGSMIFTGGGLALHPQSGARVSSLMAGKSALRGLVFAMAAELAQDNIHVATVTIAGEVAPGSAFDPDGIAEYYWQLHVQPRDAWQVERVFRG